MGDHYIPQRYLKNFQDPRSPGAIWQYDKRNRSIRRVAIKSAAQSKDFYTHEDETRLAREVEPPGNRVMAKVIAGGRIGSDDRLRLTIYIGTMLKRVPRARRKAEALIPEALEDAIQHTLQMVKLRAADAQAGEEAIAKEVKEVEKIHAQYLSEPPRSVINRIKSPWPSIETQKVIASMAWRFMVAGGPHFFITSDNPAFYFEGLGLRHQDVEMVFPISPTHAIHGSWRGPKHGVAVIHPEQRIVQEVNRRLAGGTERFAFYHREVAWLMPMLADENPYIKPIVW